MTPVRPDHIDCERVYLRPITEADRPTLQRTWTDTDVREYLGGPLPGDVLHHRKAAPLSPETLCIVKRESGEVIGFCRLAPYRADIELSYELLPEHWGHGYAAEACSALLSWGSEALPVTRIVSLTQRANERSRSLLQRLGLRLVDEYEEWGAPQCLYALEVTAAPPTGEDTRQVCPRFPGREFRLPGERKS